MQGRLSENTASWQACLGCLITAKASRSNVRNEDAGWFMAEGWRFKRPANSYD
jgi:hypothetical protein